MPALEQHKPVEQAHPQQHPGNALKSTLHETWGPNAVTKLSDKQNTNTTDALPGFNQFCIGFGDGLSHFATESVQAVGKAISNPGEAIHNGVEGVKKAVGATCEAAAAGANYVANKTSHGDFAGMANDAVHTGQALGHAAAQSIDRFNHMTAREKGYVFGHDVAPTVIGTIVAPELIPEGAAAAAFGKVASVAGAFIKEETIAAKVATTFEGAREKMTAISDKLATMTKHMEELANKPIVRDSIDIGETKVPRIRDGIIVRNVEVSKKFLDDVAAAEKTLTGLESRALNSADFSKVHNMAEQYGKDHAFSMGTWVDSGTNLEKGKLKIAEFTGFEGDLRPNPNVRHAIVHEIGHLISDRLGGWRGPLSSREPFLSAYEADLALQTPEAISARNTMNALYKTLPRRQHEVWAEGMAIASDEELGIALDAGLPQMIKAGYPNSVNHLKGFREANKL
ncbi:MAG: hypothetical protein JST89_20535 [Cyanobacteria bacterium SZAS-4]|nr:hypothetical protein [Cyanobacteria bacterium SZAS-4]